MAQKCNNQVLSVKLKYETDKSYCNESGVKKTEMRCKCFFGYYGNFCQYRKLCHFVNCWENGYCQKYENCKEICSSIDCSSLSDNIDNMHQSASICLNDCTSPSHGTCQFNGKCQCEAYWNGDDCSVPVADISVIASTDSQSFQKTVSVDVQKQKLKYQMFGF